MLRNIFFSISLLLGIAGMASASECIGPGVSGDLETHRDIVMDAAEVQVTIEKKSFVVQATGKSYSLLPTRKDADKAAEVLQMMFTGRKLQILPVRDSKSRDLIGYIAVVQAEACGDRYDPPDKNS